MLVFDISLSVLLFPMGLIPLLLPCEVRCLLIKTLLKLIKLQSFFLQLFNHQVRSAFVKGYCAVEEHGNLILGILDQIRNLLLSSMMGYGSEFEQNKVALFGVEIFNKLVIGSLEELCDFWGFVIPVKRITNGGLNIWQT